MKRRAVRDPGVVHQDVDAAEALDGPVHQSTGRRRIDCVAGLEVHGLADGEDHVLHLRRARSTGQHAPGPGLDEEPGNGKADATVAAGDERDLSVDAKLGK